MKPDLEFWISHFDEYIHINNYVMLDFFDAHEVVELLYELKKRRDREEMYLQDLYDLQLDEKCKKCKYILECDINDNQ